MFILILAVFLLRLGGLLKTLVCPPLPRRCSDRTEYAGISGINGISDQRNINIILCSRLYWPGVGSKILKTDLPDAIPGAGAVGNNPLFFPRGIYQVEDHYLKIRDWCGFFEYRIYGEKSSSVTVYPASRYLERGVPVRRNSIPEKKALFSWMKDRDFFDARPYFPGDDPRRINWKMLARHDELFIKEGNSLSPSKKSALLIFNASGTIEDTDSLLRRLSALSGQLAESGLQLTLLFPEHNVIRDFEKYTGLEKEDLLASIPPVPLKKINVPYEDGFGILYFFSSGKPGSTILRELKDSFMDSRKNLILPHFVNMDKTDVLKGWNVVQT